MTQPWTVGVEQEFLLVDPASRRPVPLAEAVAEHAGASFDVQRELTPFQIEVATPVCHSSAELAEQVLAGRRHLAKAARAAGGALLASAVPPLGMTGPPSITEDARYLRMQYTHRKMLAGQGVCGMHVHVGVPDRETAIRASNALRPWLPSLLALSANSPVEEGQDTGYASWRSIVWSRWPVGGPPPQFTNAGHYDALVSALVATEVVLDPAMVYWDVRPSTHVPTVEIRVADIPLTAKDAVVIAELVRAFVRTAADSAPTEPVNDVLLRAAYWRAARDGAEGQAIDPRTGALVPARDLLAELLAFGEDALRDAGAHDLVRGHLAAVAEHGGGAAKQRRAFLNGEADPADVVDLVLAETTADIA